MRGNDFRLRFCWRLILLFLIGNINASFFTAEVLVLYSLVGFILPLTCRLKDKWVFLLACVLLIQPLPLYYVIRACLTRLSLLRPFPPAAFGMPPLPYKVMVRFGNSPGEFMGRTNSQSCLGMGSRTCIPNGSFVFVGYVNRTTRTIPKENLKVWNKILAGALIAFFPLYGLGNMLPAFIVNKSILTLYHLSSPRFLTSHSCWYWFRELSLHSIIQICIIF